MTVIIELFRRYWWVVVLFIGLRFVGQSFLQFADERMNTAATDVQVVVVTATPDDNRGPASDIQVVVVTATPAIDRELAVQSNIEDVEPTAADALSVFVPTPTMEALPTQEFAINSGVEFWQPRRYIVGMSITNVAEF